MHIDVCGKETRFMQLGYLSKFVVAGRTNPTRASRENGACCFLERTADNDTFALSISWIPNSENANRNTKFNLRRFCLGGLGEQKASNFTSSDSLQE